MHNKSNSGNVSHGKSGQSPQAEDDSTWTRQAEGEGQCHSKWTTEDVASVFDCLALLLLSSAGSCQRRVGKMACYLRYLVTF